MESPESLELLRHILSQQEKLSEEITSLKDCLYGKSGCDGLDTSLALLKEKVEGLKGLENDLDSRIYNAIVLGFCKAISDWSQSHIVESIASFVGFVMLLILM